jgi:transposase-like protein
MGRAQCRPDELAQRATASGRGTTRVGTIDLAIPKLREGSYFPAGCWSHVVEPSGALAAVIVESYVQGVSTRKVEELVQSLGVEHLSKSQVSRRARDLDEQVKAFRERPLEGRYPGTCGSTRWCSSAARAGGS